MSEEKAKESERSPSPVRLQGDGRREGGIRAGPGAQPRVEGGGRFPQPSGDAGRGAARSGRGGSGPAESGSPALQSQRKQGL